jgi:RHS repeat-associated protein
MYGELFKAISGSTNQDKFTTYNRDTETNNDYAMARHYSSVSGRFLSSDPGHAGASLDDPQTWNGYIYAGNDAVNFIDPSGLEHEQVGCGPEVPEHSLCVKVIDDGPAKVIVTKAHLR